MIAFSSVSRESYFYHHPDLAVRISKSPFPQALYKRLHIIRAAVFHFLGLGRRRRHQILARYLQKWTCMQIPRKWPSRANTVITSRYHSSADKAMRPEIPWIQPASCCYLDPGKQTQSDGTGKRKEQQGSEPMGRQPDVKAVIPLEDIYMFLLVPVLGEGYFFPVRV